MLSLPQLETVEKALTIVLHTNKNSDKDRVAFFTFRHAYKSQLGHHTDSGAFQSVQYQQSHMTDSRQHRSSTSAPPDILSRAVYDKIWHNPAATSNLLAFAKEHHCSENITFIQAVLYEPLETF